MSSTVATMLAAIQSTDHVSYDAWKTFCEFLRGLSSLPSIPYNPEEFSAEKSQWIEIFMSEYNDMLDKEYRVSATPYGGLGIFTDRERTFLGGRVYKDLSVHLWTLPEGASSEMYNSTITLLSTDKTYVMGGFISLVNNSCESELEFSDTTRNTLTAIKTNGGKSVTIERGAEILVRYCDDDWTLPFKCECTFHQRLAHWKIFRERLQRDPSALLTFLESDTPLQLYPELKDDAKYFQTVFRTANKNYVIGNGGNSSSSSGGGSSSSSNNNKNNLTLEVRIKVPFTISKNRSKTIPAIRMHSVRDDDNLEDEPSTIQAVSVDKESTRSIYLGGPMALANHSCLSPFNFSTVQLTELPKNTKFQIFLADEYNKEKYTLKKGDPLLICYIPAIRRCLGERFLREGIVDTNQVDHKAIESLLGFQCKCEAHVPNKIIRTDFKGMILPPPPLFSQSVEEERNNNNNNSISISGDNILDILESDEPISPSLPPLFSSDAEKEKFINATDPSIVADALLTHLHRQDSQATTALSSTTDRQHHPQLLLTEGGTQQQMVIPADQRSVSVRSAARIPAVQKSQLALSESQQQQQQQQRQQQHHEEEEMMSMSQQLSQGSSMRSTLIPIDRRSQMSLRQSWQEQQKQMVPLDQQSQQTSEGTTATTVLSAGQQSQHGSVITISSSISISTYSLTLERVEKLFNDIFDTLITRPSPKLVDEIVNYAQSIRIAGTHIVNPSIVNPSNVNPSNYELKAYFEAIRRDKTLATPLIITQIEALLRVLGDIHMGLAVNSISTSKLVEALVFKDIKRAAEQGDDIVVLSDDSSSTSNGMALGYGTTTTTTTTTTAATTVEGPSTGNSPIPSWIALYKTIMTTVCDAAITSVIDRDYSRLDFTLIKAPIKRLYKDLVSYMLSRRDFIEGELISDEDDDVIVVKEEDTNDSIIDISDPLQHHRATEGIGGRGRERMTMETLNRQFELLQSQRQQVPTTTTTTATIPIPSTSSTTVTSTLTIIPANIHPTTITHSTTPTIIPPTITSSTAIIPNDMTSPTEEEVDVQMFAKNLFHRIYEALKLDLTPKLVVSIDTYIKTEPNATYDDFTSKSFFEAASYLIHEKIINSSEDIIDPTMKTQVNALLAVARQIQYGRQHCRCVIPDSLMYLGRTSIFRQMKIILDHRRIYRSSGRDTMDQQQLLMPFPLPFYRRSPATYELMKSYYNIINLLAKDIITNNSSDNWGDDNDIVKDFATMLFNFNKAARDARNQKKREQNQARKRMRTASDNDSTDPTDPT